MKGLELCRRYWENIGYPRFVSAFGNRIDDVAIGMIGPGSECFGFDDELSRDHDWGPGFCVWVNDPEDTAFIGECEEWYDDLPSSYLEFPPRQQFDSDTKRVGVDTVSDFYYRYTGLHTVPETDSQWNALPSFSLATCTNGAVFHDTRRVFSVWRETLLSFYPEAIRKRKIARLCISASQAGQYNFSRSLQRGDSYTANYCLVKYCADCASIIYLLNRRYEPFYKWVFRGMETLPILGHQGSLLISTLIQGSHSLLGNDTSLPEIVETIDRLGALVSEEMTRQGLVNNPDPYLWNNGLHVLAQIGGTV